MNHPRSCHIYYPCQCYATLSCIKSPGLTMTSVWDIRYQCFAALYPQLQMIDEILHLATDETIDIIGFMFM